MLNHKLLFSNSGKIYNPWEVLDDIASESMIQYERKFQYNISGGAFDIGTLKYLGILEVIDCIILTIFIDSEKPKFQMHNSESN